MTLLTLQPDAAAGKDTWINSELPTTNYGTATSFLMDGVDSTFPSFALVDFDLSSIPADATCDDATLTLWVTTISGQNRDYQVFALIAASENWVESEATWERKSTASTWRSGNFSTGDHDATAIGSFSYTANEAVGTAKACTLTPSAIAAHFGGRITLVVKKLGTSTSSTPNFATSDHATASERPRLAINYTAAPVGTTYYIKNGGSDAANGLSLANAWATFANSLPKLAAGDTLLVSNSGGAFTENCVLSAGATVAGTATNRITVKGIDGEKRPLINGYMRVNNAHYWTFEWLTWDGKDYVYDGLIDDVLFLRNTNNYIVRKCEIRSKPGANTQAAGSTGGYKALIHFDGDNNLIEDCYIHDNPGLNPSATQDADGNGIYQDHLIYCSEGSDDCIVRRCLLVDAPNGRAVKIGASSGTLTDPMRCRVESCTMLRCVGPTPIRISYGSADNVIDDCILGGPVTLDGNGTGIVTTHNPDSTTLLMGTVSNSWGWDEAGKATNYTGTGSNGSTANVVQGTGNYPFGTDPLLDGHYEPQHADTWSGGVAGSGTILYGHLAGLSSWEDFPIFIGSIPISLTGATAGVSTTTGVLTIVAAPVEPGYFPDVSPQEPMLLSSAGVLLAIIDDYSTLKWNRLFSDVGSFELTIPAQSTYAKMLEMRQLIVVPDEPSKAFAVETLDVTIKGGESQIVASGRSLDGWFYNPGRIVIPSSGTHETFTSQPTETIIKTLVRKNAADLAIAARQLPAFTVEADSGRGTLQTIAARYEPLIDVIRAVASVDDVGWEVIYDRDLLQHQFTYLVGVDRSATVFFDVAFDTAEAIEWARSEADATTFVYVGGAGEGATRTIVERYQGGTAPTGLNRRETFADESDTADTAVLSARGDALLNETADNESFTIVIPYSTPFYYRAHWDLGDIVTVRDDDWGLERAAQIIGINFTIDDVSSTPSIAIAVNKRIPTIQERVRQEIRALKSGIERR